MNDAILVTSAGKLSVDTRLLSTAQAPFEPCISYHIEDMLSSVF